MPTVLHQVTSLIVEHADVVGLAPDFAESKPVELHVLAPVRTLIEKLTILHHAATVGDSAEQARLARHYYDVWCLLGDEDTVAELAISPADVLAREVVTFTEAAALRPPNARRRASRTRRHSTPMRTSRLEQRSTMWCWISFSGPRHRGRRFRNAAQPSKTTHNSSEESMVHSQLCRMAMLALASSWLSDRERTGRVFVTQGMTGHVSNMLMIVTEIANIDGSPNGLASRESACTDVLRSRDGVEAAQFTVVQDHRHEYSLSGLGNAQHGQTPLRRRHRLEVVRHIFLHERAIIPPTTLATPPLTRHDRSSI